MASLPTLLEINEALTSYFETEFGQPITEDGKAELRAEIAALSGSFFQMYLAIGELQENVFPDNSDEETTIRFGVVKLGRRPFPPSAGRYNIQVTGTVGGIIPAGTVYKADDSSLNPGILYRLDEAYTLVSSPDTINVRCLTLGLTGKQNISDTMTATAPIPLVSSNVTVTEETVQPLAGESLEDYREKIITSFRYDIYPGSATSYRLWADDVQGIKRVFPFAKSNAVNEINLFVEATITDSTDGNGTPSQLMLDAYEAVCEYNPDTTLPLNKRGRRILQTILNFIAITPLPIDVTVTGFQGLTAEITTQITTAFETYLYEVRPFVAAADPVENKNDYINNITLANVIGSAKPGSIFTGLSFTVNGVAVTEYNFFNGYIPYLRTLTFA